jgi:hypothetical protein
MCEVVGVVGAGGQSLCLPLQVLQPLLFAPFHNRTLCCVGHRRFPLQAGFEAGMAIPAGWSVNQD